jgi:hypothetical protein
MVQLSPKTRSGSCGELLRNSLVNVINCHKPSLHQNWVVQTLLKMGGLLLGWPVDHIFLTFMIPKGRIIREKYLYLKRVQKKVRKGLTWIHSHLISHDATWLLNPPSWRVNCHVFVFQNWTMGPSAVEHPIPKPKCWRFITNNKQLYRIPLNMDL